MNSLRNLLLIFFAFIVGCSGVSVISRESKEEFAYRETFLTDIKKVKTLYAQGETDQALKMLDRLPEAKLSASEKAFKHNLMGVIFFDKKQFTKSVDQFNQSLALNGDDAALNAQAQLNLASSLYRLNKFPDSASTLKQVRVENLNSFERKKYFQLNAAVSHQQGDENAVLHSLINLLGDKNTIAELKSDPQFDKLQLGLKKLSSSEKIRLLEDFEDKKYLVVGYLGYLEIEQLYYGGKKDESRTLLSWLTSKFENNDELMVLVKSLDYRMESFSKIDPSAIGIVLPLTSDKAAKFAQRAMLGIDSAFQQTFGSKPKGEGAPTYFIKDSMGSGAVGAAAVKELIEKHYVSVIVGGLFSKEATAEYLEAKKYGVFFISLSQIYLPREEKGHLLLEIPGSVESLVDELFSKEMLTRFGGRGAILYPNNDRGQAYVNEFWKQATENKVEVKGAYAFDPHGKDYQRPVKKLLGLNFERERSEELSLLGRIHSLQKSGPIRRVQTLTPTVEFDWVFIPAHPSEALQIIPTFGYFDAHKIKFIGDPSWRSKNLLDNPGLGPLHFIGDYLKDDQDRFQNYFYSTYKKVPKLIEFMAYDAMKIVIDLLGKSKVSGREEFENVLLKNSFLKATGGSWTLKNGLWIKKMTPLKLKSDEVEKLFGAPEDESANAKNKKGKDQELWTKKQTPQSKSVAL